MWPYPYPYRVPQHRLREAKSHDRYAMLCRHCERADFNVGPSGRVVTWEAYDPSLPWPSSFMIFESLRPSVDHLACHGFCWHGRFDCIAVSPGVDAVGLGGPCCCCSPSPACMRGLPTHHKCGHPSWPILSRPVLPPAFVDIKSTYSILESFCGFACLQRC